MNSKRIGKMANGETFDCGCGGPVKILTALTVLHACKNKYSHETSYFDGTPRFVYYDRVTVNPALTGGTEKYNWFLRWR